MAEKTENKNNSQQEWLNETLPPPVQFGPQQGSPEDEAGHAEDQDAKNDSASESAKEDKSISQKVKVQDASNDRQSPQHSHGEDIVETKKSPPAGVEIIGHVSNEGSAVDKTGVRSFARPKETDFVRNGKWTNSRQNGVEDFSEQEVETLAKPEATLTKDEKMKFDIEQHNPLEDEEITDHEDDYGSDDTSSTSSIGDETMPSFEEASWPSVTMHRLAEPDFDVWRLGRDEMVNHLEYMYHELGITRAWRIPRATLRMFLLGVRERYQDNPYHNFKHCFCVSQMAYSMVCKLNLRQFLSADDLGMLLTAAICHDVDHPGLNNGYHSHAHSPLAILYNYKSILEQHHFAVTCRILTNRERNIFREVPNRDEILNGTRELILATDLALHKDIMEQYKRNIKNFDFNNRSHVLSLLKIIIKCADVSNEVRPENIATPWVERLFSEYYEQSAREKRERLPVTAYMDPDKVEVTDSQEGFIKGMMLPMYNELANLIMDARIYYVDPLKKALLRYEFQKGQRM